MSSTKYENNSNSRSQMMMGLHKSSLAQRKLKVQTLEREESKLLMQRTMNSLKRIISEDRCKTLQTRNKMESLASLGIDFSSLGIDDDISDLFTIEPTAPTVPPVREVSESSSSTFTLDDFDEHDQQNHYSQNYYQQQQQQDQFHESQNCSNSMSTASDEMIEVSPGYCLPLRRSDETWNAILEGRVLQTRCFCCEQELACLEDAELLACSDCWVFSPIDESSNGRKKRHGVCIGVKNTDIQEWLGSSPCGC